MLSLLALGAARAANLMQFDLPPQELLKSLRAVGERSGTNVLASSPSIAGRRAPALHGQMTVDEAFKRLLAGSGLRHEFLDEKTVTFVAADAKGASLSTATGETARPAQDKGQRVADLSLSRAEADNSAGQGAQDVKSANSSGAESSAQEIIVTAQKRAERLQDVPIPVTSISADALVETNHVRLEDYYSSIPGLSFTSEPGSGGSPNLAIRGITSSSSTNPTVGIIVDDVPYGSSTSTGGGFVAPDIDPSELQRIEVLRGPQGTLYGAGSLGGLLKYVTLDPSMERFSGRLQAGFGSVRQGDGLGYMARGSVNAPLADTFAVRVSGFTRHDAGYIDNPVTAEDGVNAQDVRGGRLAALWRPSDAFSFKLSALAQRVDSDASGFFEPQLGELRQSAVRGTGEGMRETQVYNATATLALVGAEITSVSGYGTNRIKMGLDFTPIFGPFTENGLGTFPGFGVPGTVYHNDGETDKFSQELRLSISSGERLDWLLGLFYTHERSEANQVIQAVDSAGAFAGEWLTSISPSTFREYAAFVDLTVRLTDRFDVQVGGRESRIRQQFTTTQTGVYVPIFVGVASPFIQPETRSKESAFTYLVTPRLRVSPDLIVYARLASGYRAGGPNTGAGVPPQFDPDTTSNYEIGVKSQVSPALSLDASLYYIDWQDIQLILNQRGNSYYVNAGGAKSQGIELAVEARPLSGLTLDAWVSWNDAVLTEGFPAGSQARGVSGDRLPFSSRFSANASLEQEFPLGMAGMKGFVGGSVSYVGDRQGGFLGASSTLARQDYPSYVKVDARAGVRNETWSVVLFVNNVADERGLIGGGVGTFNSGAFYAIQPRSIGMSVSRMF